jgi:hypothetical protein
VTPEAAGGLRTWAVSLGATAASTYALDACAAAAGLLLVASGLLGGVGHAWVLAILVASYAVWACALRTNVRANGNLLAATGTSTNVLSKIAHDVTRRVTGNARAPRVAAAVGYVGTEVAKELPYYAGAFGAAVLSDSITSDEALLFLAGANIGAALYEYGLARLTGAFLRRRVHASFDTDWVPAEYLADYYRTVEPDELATIAYLVGAMRRADRDRPVLFFGVGPTLHHVFAAAEVASEIHLGDYLPANLAEIRRWLDAEPGAHDWTPFVRHTLRCEGVDRPTDAEVTAREDLTRKKVTELLRVDARDQRPPDRRYATVISAYCADSATADRATWLLFMRHITALVEPGGLFVTAALRRCRRYIVAGKAFPAADVDEHDLRAALCRDFRVPHDAIEVRTVAQAATHGYSAIVLGQARRRDDGPGNRDRPATGRSAVEVGEAGADAVGDDLAGVVDAGRGVRPVEALVGEVVDDAAGPGGRYDAREPEIGLRVTDGEAGVVDAEGGALVAAQDRQLGQGAVVPAEGPALAPVDGGQADHIAGVVVPQRPAGWAVSAAPEAAERGHLTVVLDAGG